MVMQMIRVYAVLPPLSLPKGDETQHTRAKYTELYLTYQQHTPRTYSDETNKSPHHPNPSFNKPSTHYIVHFALSSNVLCALLGKATASSVSSSPTGQANSLWDWTLCCSSRVSLTSGGNAGLKARSQTPANDETTQQIY